MSIFEIIVKQSSENFLSENILTCEEEEKQSTTLTFWYLCGHKATHSRLLFFDWVKMPSVKSVIRERNIQKKSS